MIVDLLISEVLIERDDDVMCVHIERGEGDY